MPGFNVVVAATLEFLEVVYIFLIDSLHVMVCKACGAG
jgi:hypothetical protein